MMGKTLFTILVFFSFTIHADIKKNINAFIDAGKPNRTVGSKGHKGTQKFILKWLKGIKSARTTSIQEHLFMPDVEWAASEYQNDFDTKIKSSHDPKSATYKKWDQFTKEAIRFTRSFAKIQGKNIIFEISGAKDNKRVLYIGAHYDTITHDKTSMKFTPDAPTLGADDNASSVAIMMELIEHFALNPPNITLRFVFIDYEEIFFQGSYALAKDISKGKLSGMKKDEVTLGLLSLEMLGYKKNNQYFKLYTRPKADKGAIRDLYLAGKIQAASKKGKFQAVVLDNGFNRSDNWPFWLFNLPSVCITQDWENDFNENNYHTTHDDPKFLNFSFMNSVALTLKEAISSIDKD